ncbi:MBL fold metallo-hydrolase [Novosphingobium sp. JCM 18896]|uniref:MBL fold metallo-hydrolase n=1 Tax=Novosphingobium sp. JCM 18896 TaxID=2989731 RepID=UPI002222F5AC|nr:MBL fold metallo-hydrolase [Novosphingobium sp. JCM 18896]MCW1431164.1 MBL fold metallo-hydrolase [Novosphingobium sp. JCM 18896]
MSTQPKLADFVRSGDAQTDAVEITPFVFMARGVSNAHLVTTSDGDVIVNCGMPEDGERAKVLFAPHRTGPIRYIILTQSHADHFGGVPEFQEEGTQIVGGPDYVGARDDMMGLQSFFGKRTFKLWGSTLKRDKPPMPIPQVTPDIFVDRELTLDVGDRTFQLISAPEGETVDNIVVWMPKEKIVFTGNTFGPVWLSMPFLNTLRGDKPRLVKTYLKSLEKIRALGAEIVVTGHGEPIVGKERIKADLDKMHAAVSYVRDYTLEGMKAGKTVHQLMREFAFPDDIKIGDFHGKAMWAVKSIWREYSGWFHYEDGTTELYGVPRSSVDADLVELAGGAEKLAERAKARLDAGEPLEALHLVAIALGAEPGNRAALLVKKDASALLLERSGQSNLSETMWLRSEIADVDAALGA